MRILLLTQVVPYPPDSGPKVKTHGVLRHLARRHEVHLASFARSDDEEARARDLRGLCAETTTVRLRRSGLRDAGYLARSLITGRPFLIDRDDSRAMRAAVGDLVRRHSFDAAHADQLAMAQFTVDLPVPLRVLDEHNAVWAIVRRAASRERGPRRALAELEWRKLRRYEGETCRAFDRITVVSDADRAALEQAAGTSLRTEVVPIAVDTRELAFAPRGPAARHVLSVATMYYPPNAEGVRWFASEVFPLVRREAPDVEFRVVGSRPPGPIAALAGPGRGVAVMGYVPDLAPVFRESAVVVVPVHSGSGMRVKILEAFARGVPVVSTTVGVEGIAARGGEHLLVADEPADFARAVVRLLREPEEAARLARAGRALVEASYDWRTALAGLDRVYSASGASASPLGRRAHDGAPPAGG